MWDKEQFNEVEHWSGITDGTPTSITTMGQSWPGSNGNDGIAPEFKLHFLEKAPG